MTSGATAPGRELERHRRWERLSSSGTLPVPPTHWEVALMGEYARTVAAGSRTTTGVRRPMTSHRTKQPTPAGKAEWGLLGALGRPGQDRRSAADYAADLARETEASLRRHPKRWRTRRTIEVPKDRSSPGGTP